MPWSHPLPPNPGKGQEGWGWWGAPRAVRTILSPPQLPEMLALSLVQADMFPFHSLPSGKKGSGVMALWVWVDFVQSKPGWWRWPCLWDQGTRSHEEMPAPCCPGCLSAPGVQGLELPWVAARATFAKVPLCSVCPCQAELCSSSTTAGDAASAVTPLPPSLLPSPALCLGVTNHCNMTFHSCLFRLRLRDFHLPYSRITPISNVGLQVSISNAFAELDGDWRVKFLFVYVPSSSSPHSDTHSMSPSLDLDRFFLLSVSLVFWAAVTLLPQMRWIKQGGRQEQGT